MSKVQKLVGTWLQVNRLPLSAVETAVGRRGDASWPGAVAYEAFESTVKRAVGTALRDPDLLDEARLQQAEVRKRREAVELEARAEQRRVEADQQQRERQRQADRKAAEADRRARQQEEAVEQEKAERREAVIDAAAKKKQTATKIDSARKKAVERQQRAARETRLDEEAAALAEEQRAVEVRGEVRAIDDAIETSKATRRQS